MKQAMARRIFEEWSESTEAPEASLDPHVDGRHLAETRLPTFFTSPHLGRSR